MPLGMDSIVTLPPQEVSDWGVVKNFT